VSKRTACNSESEIVEVGQAEAAAMFDGIARRQMGISGEEFLRRFDAGQYDERDADDVPGLVETWMALPLVR
jgi:hypothetical protein